MRRSAHHEDAHRPGDARGTRNELSSARDAAHDSNGAPGRRGNGGSIDRNGGRCRHRRPAGPTPIPTAPLTGLTITYDRQSLLLILQAL